MHRQCPALLLPGTKGQATLFHFSFHYMFSCQQRDHEPLVSFSCLVFQTLGARTLLGHSPYLGSFRFRAFLDLFFFFSCVLIRSPAYWPFAPQSALFAVWLFYLVSLDFCLGSLFHILPTWKSTVPPSRSCGSLLDKMRKGSS